MWVDVIGRGDPGWTPYDTARRLIALLTETVTMADDPVGDERAA